MKKLPLSLLIIAAAILSMAYIGLLPHHAGGWRPPAKYLGRTPVKIIFQDGGRAGAACRVILRDQRITRICSGKQEWRTIVFADGSRLNAERGAPSLNYTLVEEADLNTRQAWIIEEADTEKIGLKHYLRILTNTSFHYEWVNLSGYMESPYGFKANISAEEGIVLPLAFYTYEEGMMGVHYYPAPGEYFKLYGAASHAWCWAEETILGVKCTVIPVNPGTHCIVAGIYVKPEEFPEISCGCYKGFTVIAVVEMPGVPGLKTDHGGFFMGDKILIVGREKPRVFLHHLGHVFGLPDVNPSITGVMQLLFNNSAMSGGDAISLGDTVLLAASTYAEYKSTSLASTILKDAARYGIDARHASILLPLTPEGRLPPPINRIVGIGVVSMDEEGWKPNTTLLNLMKLVSQAAGTPQS